MAFILAIFVFSLSLTPCSDVSTTELMDVNHSEHSEDDCSPFCSCTCCGIAFSVNILHSEDSEPKNIDITSRLPIYKNLYSQRYITSVWHPPTFIK